MRILNKLKLNRSYYFHGELTELEQRISEISTDLVSKKSDTEYKFYSRTSLGVLIVKSAPGLVDAINVKAEITSINANKHLIKFSSSIRIEHLFFVFLFSIIIYAIYASDQPIKTLLFVIALWPVFHLWFQFIFRVQEKGLVEDVAKIIKLKKLPPTPSKKP